MAPVTGADLRASVDQPFRWRWEGQLIEGQSFEVRIWQNGEYHLGAYDISRLPKAPGSDGVYQFSFKPMAAASVQRHGAGDYNVTVAVVTGLNYQTTLTESSPVLVHIDVAGEAQPDRPPTPSNSGGR